VAGAPRPLRLRDGGAVLRIPPGRALLEIAVEPAPKDE
jgi:hypothetical protein